MLAVATSAAITSSSANTDLNRAVASSNVHAIDAGAARGVFAPGTDPAYVAEHHTRLDLDTLGGPEAHQLANRWNPAATAMNNGGSQQGDSLELTWSIVPDGTFMPPSSFDSASPAGCTSNLIAQFDATFGAGIWQAELQRVWDDWSAASGNEYTPAVALDGNGTPVDDGAPWPTSGGVAGVRGDIRIGGCAIDGNSGALAYNFFPNNGDMKVDAVDNFYGDPRFTLSTAVHNVFSHEHGHGAGLSHVCPVDETKLMEPFISLAFTGLQHDDVRGIQRHYGDRLELINMPNDNQSAATKLPASDPPLAPGLRERYEAVGVSLDSTSDTDWFEFEVEAWDRVSVVVTPVGWTYRQGPMGASCSGAPTPNIDSKALQNLSFELRNADGVLLTSETGAAGQPESVSQFSTPASGPLFVRVFSSGGTDDTQLYDLSISLEDGAPPPAFDFGDAPDPTYPTLLANDGARHAPSGLYLGAAIDSELDGLPNAGATGDDSNGGGDDEDGVDFPDWIEPGSIAEVSIVSSAAGLLNAWIDYDADGDWDDAGEHALVDLPVVAGTNTVDVAVPASAAPNATFGRFRLSSASGLLPTGAAADGEVEDHRITIRPVDEVDPVISVTAPQNGAEFAVDAVETASYTCSDALSGVASCLGDVASGAAIDTSSEGAQTFTVTAADHAGNTTTVVRNYTVDGTAPSITISSPGDGEVFATGEIVNADFACLDPGTGVSSCVGDVDSGSPLDTSSSGDYTFTVTATDDVGNLTTTSHGYTVVGPDSAIGTVDPARLLDTRASGVTIDGESQRTGRVGAGSFVRVRVAGRAGVPDNASAAMLNLAGIRPLETGFATLYPCTESPPVAASLNYVAGQNVSNATTVMLSSDGDICAYSSSDADFAIDVVGFVTATVGDVGTVEPARLLETRASGDTIDGESERVGRVSAGSFERIRVAGRAGVPDDASAAMLNLAAIRPNVGGFATLYPCTEAPPNASSLNFVAGQNISNATTVELSGDGDVCVFSSAEADYAIDVVGYFSAGTAIVGTVEPARLLDSRESGVTVDGQSQQTGLNAAGSFTRVRVAGRAGVPRDASAAVLNLAAIRPVELGFATLYPCSDSPPLAASLNFAARQNVSNATVVKLSSDGDACVFTSTDTHVAIDVMGYIAARPSANGSVQNARGLAWIDPGADAQSP